jgi:hypothetical protein
MTDFRKDFIQFLSERVSSACSNDTDSQEEQEIAKRVSRLTDKITELLGQKNFDLIFDYEQATNLRHALTLDKVYKAGLRDGVALVKELGLI